MRNQNPKVTYMNLAETRVPEMRYDGKGDFWQWQADAKAKDFMQKSQNPA